MPGPAQLMIRNLDKPQRPINLNLIQLQKTPLGFQKKGRIRTNTISNGKPTVIIVWVTTHPPCLKNLPRYELLAGLADQLQTVNFIFLDYNPDYLTSENLTDMTNIFADYVPPFPIFVLDPAAPEAEHPKNQFQSFIVPEFIMLDGNHRTIEHFVLNDHPSFTKALSLIARPPQPQEE